ncbi:MAG: formyltetrahydrofolate deformylase, partial [Candidatus Omnitrophota bacterium]
MAHGILLISCSDQRGITASVTNFIAQNDGNIIHADQHIDTQSNTFFMRIEWTLDTFTIVREDIRQAFAQIAHNFKMKWTLHFTDETPRVALF